MKQSIISSVGVCTCMLVSAVYVSACYHHQKDINSILITWTFFRATDVLPNRYLAWYTSLNWPRPIFFSIWKFASELWPISGCNGFWKIWKQTALVRFGHAGDTVEKQNTPRTSTKTGIRPLELKNNYKNCMIIPILIPGLLLIMPQWPWTLIGRSCWGFAGVPVGSVTFKLTPSCELSWGRDGQAGRRRYGQTSEHTDLDAESRILLSSTSSPWTTCAP